ncbi:MAG TPA: Calx-beta domain-containing protein, partial [Candidatus Dormibacteraeota bacterium]|nr:Calx-beta domain-containing protein [Candidatus Dormibacteraeota bacterium]
FEQPRGITVNKNPATGSFGRIYIANGRVGTTVLSNRTTIDGIYMLNSDDTAALDTGATPRTAGLPFTTVSDSASPLRVTIGKDDNLLYISDLSDPSGGLWVCDLDVATNAVATNVLWQIGDTGFGATNHGSVYAAVVEGSLGGGNLTLFTMDEDLAPANTAWRYTIGSGPLPSSATQTSLGQAMTNTAIKLIKGGVSNFLYASQNNRSATIGGPTVVPSIRVFKPDGTTVTNSLDASRQFSANPSAADILQNTISMDISPDGSTLALLRGATYGSVLLVPLTNGVFNFAATNSFSIGANGASDNNRDIAYDIAGNLYVVNSGSEFFRIFSKGGASVAISGTDGTFALSVPPTLVSVTASTPTANEQGPVNGVFTVTRAGDTSVALTVNYTVSGTATPGSDYVALPGSVTFLPNAASTNITVQVLNDSVTELTESAVINLSGSANYGVTAGSATVSILDNEPTEISLTPAAAENRLLEGYSESKLGMVLTRRGLISPAVTVNLAFSGLATRGIDYNAAASVIVAASTDTATFNLTPIDDDQYEGDESITVAVGSGSGYAIGTTNSASAVLVDDDYPAGVVLFSDNFETDSSANWVVNTVDGGVDSSATFGYDYSQRYVPAVPGGISTKGLLFRLNEQTGAQRNAISASPASLNLPDQYRLKFKMWNNYNGPMFDGGSGSTMHLTAGVGTTPDHANLATSGASDGIWFDVDGDGGSTFTIGDANAYVGFTLQADNSGVYAADPNNNPRSTTSPYYSIWGGIPAPAAQLANNPSQTGTSQPGNMGESWHTVVLTKTTNTVTWTIDGITIATVPADSTSLGPNVFVGFEDIFPGPSGATNMSFALIENLRVETFVSAPIRITGIRLIGGNVEITFTGPAAAAATDFKLQSSPAITGGYADDNSATLTLLGAGSFKATTAVNGARNFYRIKQ